MKYKLIGCEVFEREINHCLSGIEQEVDVEYTKKSAHDKPEILRDKIQEIIDASPGYDAILLGYGLCGNAINGLRAGESPFIIPRAHDCCTLFLGSRRRFNELFEGRESMPWGCTGYCEKDGGYLRTSETGSVLGYDRTYEQFVEEYGEENAKFIWETIHPVKDIDDVLFINIPETYDHAVYEAFREEMSVEGKAVTMEPGHLGIFRKLLGEDWDGDFLVVSPERTVEAVYDREEIISAALV